MKVGSNVQCLHSALTLTLSVFSADMDVNSSNFFRGRDITLIRTDMNNGMEIESKEPQKKKTEQTKGEPETPVSQLVPRYSKGKKYTVCFNMKGTIGLSLNGSHIRKILESKYSTSPVSTQSDLNPRLKHIIPYVDDVTRILARQAYHTLHSCGVVQMSPPSTTLSYSQVLNANMQESFMRESFLRESFLRESFMHQQALNTLKRQKTSDGESSSDPSEPVIHTEGNSRVTEQSVVAASEEIRPDLRCKMTPSDFEIHRQLFPEFYTSPQDMCMLVSQSSSFSLPSMLSQLQSDHQDDAQEDGTLSLGGRRIPSLATVLQSTLSGVSNNVSNVSNTCQ